MNLFEICKEDKVQLLESIRLSSKDSIEELIKTCIVNNSRNCFIYFLKTYSFKITFNPSLSSGHETIYIDQIEKIDLDILKTCFYLIKTKSVSTQHRIIDFSIIIKECTRRMFTIELGTKKINNLVNYIQEELIEIDELIEILCLEEKNILFDIGTVFKDLQPKFLRHLIKHDNIEYVLYFSKEYEGPFDISFDFIWNAIISYNKYEMFNQCYEQLMQPVSEHDEFVQKWLLSLVEYCITDYNLDFLKFLDDKFCEGLIKYNKLCCNKEGPFKLLFQTFLDLNIHIKRNDQYPNLIEILKFLVTKGCQLYEKDLIFCIENMIGSNNFTLERYIIDHLRKGMLNNKLSNSYLLLCLERNMALFYYLIDNDLINNAYEVSLLKMMESFLFHRDAILTNETDMALPTRKFNEEFSNNKNWWIGYLMFANLYNSKYYKIGIIKKSLTKYRLYLKSECNTVLSSKLPKDLVNIIVEYI